MRLNSVDYQGAAPIDGYAPGFFRIGGKVVEGAVLLLPGAAPVGWAGPADLREILAAADRLDVLFVGTGAEVAPLDAAVRTALEDAGIGVEIMATPTACRTFNVLLAEGRRIGAALLPV